MPFNIHAQVKLIAPTNAAQIAAKVRQQLQNINATVHINISRQGQRNLQAANKNLTTTTKTTKQAAGAMSDFGKQAALAGKRFFAFTIATTAILKFTGAVRDGIKDAIDFQREVVKISQVTGNSLSNLKGLTKEITKLSTSFGVASSQLLKASRILSQTGLAADQVRISLAALAKSDLAPTFDDIISTTEGSIAIFRQFGVSADQLEKKLGSINAVAGKFAVESGDIITAVRRTGGAFAAAGGSLEDLIALFTSVRSTTRESAESIATGFRTIFTRLQRVRTQNFLESLGIDLKDVKGQFVGPLEAVRSLSVALKSLRSTDPRFAQIIEELGGFRQVSKVIPLIQQFDTAEKALGVAMAGTGSLAKDAVTAQQSLAVQIQKTREEFSALMRTFADSASFKGMVKLALRLADALIKVAATLEPLIPLMGVLGSLAIGKLITRNMGSFKGAGGFGFGFSTGGEVRGRGSGDKIPALLEAGEFVLNRNAAAAAGIGTLTRHNNAHSRFQTKPNRSATGMQTGGLVGMKTGGIVKGAGGFGKIGLALAGIASIASTFKDLNGETQKFLSQVVQLGTQAGLLFVAFKSLVSGAGGFDRKIEAAKATKGKARAELDPVGFQQAQLKTTRAREAYNIRKQRGPGGRRGGVTQKSLDRFSGAVDNEAVLKAKRDTNLAQIRSQNAVIKANKNQQKETLGAGIALAALAGIVNVVADSLIESGRADITAGKGSSDFVTGKTLSGGVKGAASGAIAGGALGSIIPGVGTAIGAAVGGVIGAAGGGVAAFNSALKEAVKILTLHEFNKDLEATGRIFASINEGRTDFTTQKGALQRNARSSRVALATGELGNEGRQDVVAGFKGQMEGFTAFFTSVAKKSTKFEDFIESVGQQTFEDVSDLGEIPINELTTRYKDQIAKQNKAIESTKKMTELTDEYGNQLRNIIGLGRAFNDVSLTMKRFEGTINTLMGFAGGGSGSFRVADESARLGTPGEFFDTGKFSEVLNRDVTNNAFIGGAGAELGADMKEAQDAVNKLPAVLLELREGIGAFDEKDAVGKLMEKFKDSGPLVQNAIKIAANKIIGSEGREEKLISEIQTDLLGVAKKLGEAFNPTFETMAKISKAMTEEKNRRLDYIDKLNSLTSTEIDLKNKGVNIEERSLRLLAKASGKPANLNKLQKLDTQKLTNIGAGSDPRKIGNNLETAKNKLLKLQNKYAAQSLKTGKAHEKQIIKQKEIITRSNIALQHLSDVGARTAVTMEKIGKLQGKQDFRKNALDQAIFASSPEDKRTQATTMRAGRVLAKTGDIDQIPMQFRKGAEALIKSLPDGFKLEGRSKEEILTDVRTKSLTKATDDTGKRIFTDKQVAALAEGFSEADKSEYDKLGDTLGKQTEAAQKANEALLVGLESAQEKLIKGLKKSIKTFGKELKDIINAQKVQEAEQTLAGATGRASKASATKGNLEVFKSLFGGEGTDEERTQRALGVGRNLKEIKTIDELTKKQEGSGSFISQARQFSETKFGSASGVMPSHLRGTGPAQTLAQRLVRSEETTGPRTRENTAKDIAALKQAVLDETGNENIAEQFAQNLRTQLNSTFTVKEKGGKATTTGRDLLESTQAALGQTATELEAEFATLADLTSALTTNLGGPLNDFDFSLIMGDFDVFHQQAQSFKDLATSEDVAAFDASLAKLTDEADLASIALAKIGRGGEGAVPSVPSRSGVGIQRGGLIGFNGGGTVPGSGSGDKVPALLEPGEFVLNRNAVSAAGAGNLQKFNSKFSRFQSGGRVKMQSGGGVVGIGNLSEIVQKFGNKIDLLAESVNSINGMEIQLMASHKVEVIINGAAVMQGLMPSVQSLIVAETNKAINSMLKSKFPDVGTVN